MSLAELFVIALGLAMDAFAVAVASSVALGKASPRQVFRLSFHFGLFQAMMPALGWLAGLSVRDSMQSWDHWVAFGLLVAIGGRACWAALHGGEEEERKASDPTRGASLVSLSIATSIDALAVGVSFSMLRVVVWQASAVIGVVAGAMTVLGMALGARLGARFGERMELVGGLVLIGIGLKILADHLLR
jgi:putative Mn2+ efflux pump MntP